MSKKEVAVDWTKRDRYGRIVGKVWVQPSDCPTCPMTLDTGQAQLAAGMAWWYRKFAKEQSPADCRLYELAEQQVQAQRLGLWADKNPIPPWGFRHAEDGADLDQQLLAVYGSEGRALLHG